MPASCRRWRACSRKLDAVLAERPLRSWGRYRWADLLLSVHWLYERTGEPWLLALGARIQDQGYDWRAQFKTFPYWDKVHRIERDQSTHGVNVAMALKAYGVWSRQSGDPADRALPLRMLDLLDRYHGQATGHVLLRRAPGRPEPVPGQRALRRRRSDVLARSPALDDRRARAGGPAGAAGVQRPAGHAHARHLGAPVRPAGQSGRLPRLGRARLDQQRPRVERLRAPAELSDAARRTCTRAGRSTWRTSGCARRTTAWPPSPTGRAPSGPACAASPSRSTSRPSTRSTARSRSAVRAGRAGPVPAPPPRARPGPTAPACTARRRARAASSPAPSHVVDREWRGETRLTLDLPLADPRRAPVQRRRGALARAAAAGAPDRRGVAPDRRRASGRRLGSPPDDPLGLRPRPRSRRPRSRASPWSADRSSAARSRRNVAPLVVRARGRRVPGWGLERGCRRAAARQSGPLRRAARNAHAAAVRRHRPAPRRAPGARIG